MRTRRRTLLVGAGIAVAVVVVAGAVLFAADRHHGGSSKAATFTPPPARPGGWPGPDNTGVLPGSHLTPSGSLTITDAGTVVHDLDITGCLVIRADDVIVQNTRVREDGDCGGGGIDTGFEKRKGVRLIDVEVDGQRKNPGQALVGSAGFTCSRCNLHDGGQGFHLTDNVVVEDSWVHDLYGAGDTHNDAVLSNGGHGFVVRHNTLTCDVGTPGNASPGGGCTGALNLFGDFGPVSDVVADGNLFNGGSYCVYGGSQDDKPFPHASDIRFTDNVFGRKFYERCGQYGPTADFDSSAPGNLWQGNHFEDGTPLP